MAPAVEQAALRVQVRDLATVVPQLAGVAQVLFTVARVAKLDSVSVVSTFRKAAAAPRLLLRHLRQLCLPTQLAVARVDLLVKTLLLETAAA